MIILNGKETARAVLQDIRNEACRKHIVPGLAVIIVGDRPDSRAYVENKRRTAESLGFHSVVIELPETTDEEEILNRIDILAADFQIDGILVQLPLPPHIRESVVLCRIPMDKDVDGFSSSILGSLAGKKVSLDEKAVPCTALGIIELLRAYNVEMAGKHAVVIGRSRIVGLPASLLLLRENATVTTCHSQTEEIENIVSTADILVVAVGKPKFVKSHWIKQGAVVVDVGMNPVIGKDGKNLGFVGDVDDSKEVSEKCSFLSPVPGGVGPMTVAMLMRNSLKLAILHQHNSTQKH